MEFQKTRWSDFTAILERELHPNCIDFRLPPSRFFNLIGSKILACAKRCLTRSRVRKYKRFWSQELYDIKTKRNRLRRNYKLIGRLLDAQAWKRQSAHLKKSVITEKGRSFKKFITDVNFQKDTKNVFKFLSGVKNVRGRAPKQPFRIDNKSITSGVEIDNAFVKYFLKVIIGTGMLKCH